MTREEAIQWLTNEKWNNANNKYKRKWNEAFDLAIEALQTINNCDQCEWCCPSDGTPTIHAVRCKDCKYRCKEPIYSNSDPHCIIYSVGDCELCCRTVGDNDFCSRGERREP